MKKLVWLLVLVLMAAGVAWFVNQRGRAQDLSRKAGKAGHTAKEVGEEAGRRAKGAGEKARDGAEILGGKAIEGAREIGEKAADGAKAIGRRTGDVAEAVGQKVKQKAGDLSDSQKCAVAQGYVRRCLPMILEGRSETTINARCRAAFVAGEEDLKRGVLCLHDSQGDCPAVNRCLALPVWAKFMKK
jgi:hypothetical protein